MASSNIGEFDTLFNKSVPHILEKIFFSLDYDSLMTCRRVCRTWNSLLLSESYQRRSEELLEEKKKKKKSEEELSQFSKEGNVEEVRNLLSSGMDPNFKSIYCYLKTPLHYAASNGHIEVAKLLLGAGADPNKSGLVGGTRLFLATKCGHADVVKLLLNEGADPNKANDYGDIPLKWAASNGRVHIAQMLLDAGANPNKVDCYGKSPLYEATCYDGHNRYERNADVVKVYQSTLVKVLLDHGADPNIGAFGDSPLSKALYNGNKIVVQLLIDRGAKK